MEDIFFLTMAISKAQESIEQGGFPAGAVIVRNGQVISEGISIGNKLNDPTGHGEMSAIRDACKNLATSDLTGSTLYASMEPCSMCLSASMWASVSKIVFACPKNKVSEEYYGGHYQSNDLNKTFLRSCDLHHLIEMENESLDVVKRWEDSFK